MLSLFCFLAAILATSPQDRLGRIEFPTSAGAAAQARFLRGVLLLHSFEYDDAREEFRAAEKLEPRLAIAYWGEAMTFNHPIWMEQDRAAAVAALARLAPTREARSAAAPTAREKAYLHAVEVLYGEGDKNARDLQYAGAMRALAEAYPDDAEASTFYALSLLGTCHEGRDFATYMKAAGVLEQVFQKNPEHPGAVHYLIHCYDDPIHAPLGLRPARVYARIAAAAGHAQHMPSHVFLALGMWDETAASNEAAWRVSEERVRRKRLSLDDLDYHALSWLHYAYLQQGRLRDAHRLLTEMEKNARESGSSRARTHLARMRAAQIVETRNWRELPSAPAGASGGAAAAEAFARGLAALETGDVEGARRALGSLRPLETPQSGHAHRMSGSYSGEKGTTVVLEQELTALIAVREGKRDQGIAVLAKTAAAEDSMTFDFGPPDIVKPSHELLGEVLLEAKRPREAEAEFRKALARAPGRALSLHGWMTAAAEAGDRKGAEEALADYQKVRRRADRDVAERLE